MTRGSIMGIKSRLHRGTQVGVLDKLREETEEMEADGEQKGEDQIKSAVFISNNPSESSVVNCQEEGLLRGLKRQKVRDKKLNLSQQDLNILEIASSSKKKTEFVGINWNIMGRVRMLNRFIQALKASSNLHNWSKMTAVHFNIIGDKSHVMAGESSRIGCGYFLPFFENSMEILRRISRLGVLGADNVIVLIFYNAIVFSLSILTAFSELIVSSFEIQSNEYALFRKMAGFTFLLEVLVRFNTATYQEGVPMFSREAIAKEYFRFFFWVDAISCLVLIYVEPDVYSLSLLAFFLRCVKIWRLSRDLNDHFRIWYRFPMGWELAKLFFMIVILAHFWGCQFHYIGRIQESEGMFSWLDSQNLVSETWEVKYINSFYFTTISMITIGYGDIVPKTSMEKVYVTFVAILGSCVFSYIVNTIGSIFQEISSKEAAFKQQKNHIFEYMEKRKVNLKLQLKVLKYLEYTRTRQTEGPLKGQIILNSMAKNIKEEVQLDYFGNILLGQSIFALNFSKECLQTVALKMKEVMYGPGEMIQTEGELDCKIFFIRGGEVSLFINKGNSVEEIAKLTVMNEVMIVGVNNNLQIIERIDIWAILLFRVHPL